MDYLPTELPADKIYRENAWSKLFTFTEGFLDDQDVVADFYVENTPIGYTVTPDVDGVNLTLNVPVDKVRELPAAFTYKLSVGDTTLLSGYVRVTLGSGTNNAGILAVNITEGRATFIEISNYAVNAALTAEATIARDEAVAAADEVAQSRRLSVATRSAIDAHLESGTARLFEVAIDETLGNSTLVPYRWNGSVLFMYDIYPADPQPTL